MGLTWSFLFIFSIFSLIIIQILIKRLDTFLKVSFHFFFVLIKSPKLINGIERNVNYKRLLLNYWGITLHGIFSISTQLSN